MKLVTRIMTNPATLSAWGIESLSSVKTYPVPETKSGILTRLSYPGIHPKTVRKKKRLVVSTLKISYSAETGIWHRVSIKMPSQDGSPTSRRSQPIWLRPNMRPVQQLSSAPQTPERCCYSPSHYWPSAIANARYV